MNIETLRLDQIHIGPRQRPVNTTKAAEIAKSIEIQGLLQPIGVQPLDDSPKAYRLVFGAHRIAAVQMLEQTTIAAYVLPADWSADACLLAELQENCARNDLSRAQRKQYVADIGRILARLGHLGNSAHGREGWMSHFADKSGIPIRTMTSWWNAFCQEQGVTLSPRQALDVHKQQFLDWLEEQQRQAEAEQQRKAEEAWTYKQAQDLAKARESLQGLIGDYGAATVWTEAIVPVFGPRISAIVLAEVLPDALPSGRVAQTHARSADTVLTIAPEARASRREDDRLDQAEADARHTAMEREEEGSHTGVHETIPPFDATKYRLGKLCPRGHAYSSTGQSLLRVRDRHCIACDREKTRERRPAQGHARRGKRQASAPAPSALAQTP